jgi:DNA polymerase-3 subunit epsilon
MGLIRVGDIVFDPSRVLIDLNPPSALTTHCVKLHSLGSSEDSDDIIHTFVDQEAEWLLFWIEQNALDLRAFYHKSLEDEYMSELAALPPLVEDEDQRTVDRREVTKWAEGILSEPELYCILDTETTGLEQDDEIVQIAVIEPEHGKVLFESLVKPQAQLRHKGWTDAERIHGISPDQVKDAPKFDQIWPELKAVIGNRKIIVYNRPYDASKIYETADSLGIREEVYNWFASRWAECAMQQYAQFVGEWNPKFGNYKWQKLPGGDHSAKGDCLAVLQLLHTMARSF